MEEARAYQIFCLNCRKETWAGNSADLIESHTDHTGPLVCSQCGETETYIERITGRQEREPETEWNEYIKAVVRVTPATAAYTPYALLTAKSPGGEVSAIRLSYYLDSGPNGRLVEGPGPGTAPALTPDELRRLLIKLEDFGVIRSDEYAALAEPMRADAPACSVF